MRRAKELEQAALHVREADRRVWVALRRSYSVAEQMLTRDFQTTVIFEPFGGKFGVTRMASAQFGWTNSQPLALLDGYDLLSRPGQRLLQRTLEEHDPYLTLVAFDCRMWSLLTNTECRQGHAEASGERLSRSVSEG